MGLSSQHAGGWGRRIPASSKPAWGTHGVQGQPQLQGKTLSQTTSKEQAPDSSSSWTLAPSSLACRLPSSLRPLSLPSDPAEDHTLQATLSRRSSSDAIRTKMSFNFLVKFPPGGETAADPSLPRPSKCFRSVQTVSLFQPEREMLLSPWTKRRPLPPALPARLCAAERTGKPREGPGGLRTGPAPARDPPPDTVGQSEPSLRAPPRSPCGSPRGASTLRRILRALLPPLDLGGTRRSARTRELLQPAARGRGLRDRRPTAPNLFLTAF